MRGDGVRQTLVPKEHFPMSSLMIMYTQPLSHKAARKIVYHMHFMSTNHLSSHLHYYNYNL